MVDLVETGYEELGRLALFVDGLGNRDVVPEPQVLDIVEKALLKEILEEGPDGPEGVVTNFELAVYMMDDRLLLIAFLL